MQTQSEAALLTPTYYNDDVAGDYKNQMQEIGLCRDNEVGSTILMPGQKLQGTGFKATDLRDLAEQHYLETFFDNYRGSHPPFPPINLTTEDVTRYKMAWRALKCYRQLGFDKDPTSSRFSLLHWFHYYPFGSVQRCRDWPDIEDVLKLPIALGFTSAAMIYGGLHALAWSAQFESSTQQLLWRISTCAVMGGLPVCWALVKASDYTQNNFPERLYLDDIFWGLMLAALALVALAYMLARAYLVVECFINLSHLPAGVYNIPSWSAYFPHIS